MMFGVVVCPKCQRARGVRLGSARAKCVHCGHSIDLSKARVFYRTDSEQELAAAVKKMMEKLAQGVEGMQTEKKRRRSPPPKKDRVHLVEEELRAIAQELTEKQGLFTPEQFMRRAGLKSAKDAQDLLETMLSEGVILEPRPERYRTA